VRHPPIELLRGSTLEALLNQADYKSSPQSVAWAAAIAAQIAAVLADVHRFDIAHRDIKPGNVMIIDGGLVKLLDFGIAILRGAAALPRLTQVDRTVVNPAYMSPEQCLGQAFTAASDIYSLGCLLLELLTGNVPFFATLDTPLRSHRLSTAALSARSPRADVPAVLDALASSMLAKDPGARPTAATIYEALLPLTTTGPGPEGPTRKPGPQGEENRDPTRPFRRPLLAPAASRHTRAEGSAELADAEAAMLQDTARAAAVLDAAGRDYRQYFRPDDPDVLDCAHYAGHAYAETGKPGKALPQLRFYVQNADSTAGGDEARKILETRFVIAQLLAADGYPDEALVELQSVRPLLADAFGPGSVQIHNLDKQAAGWTPPQ